MRRLLTISNPVGWRASETQYSEKKGHNIQHPLFLFDAHIVTRVSEVWKPTGPRPICLKHGIPWATIFPAPRGVGCGGYDDTACWRPLGSRPPGCDLLANPPGCGLNLQHTLGYARARIFQGKTVLDTPGCVS
ncbi:MAG: hypothetical protein QXI20_12390 [Candidatus Jordarchaeales archaeon]